MPRYLVEEITNAGTGSFTIPYSVNEIIVEAWGSGAGGGSGTGQQRGGGGAAYARTRRAITTGNTSTILYYSIGAGGESGANGAYTNVSFLSDRTSPFVSANGGHGSNGGLATNSIGDIKYDGAAGQAAQGGGGARSGSNGGSAGGPAGPGIIGEIASATTNKEISISGASSLINSLSVTYNKVESGNAVWESAAISRNIVLATAESGAGNPSGLFRSTNYGETFANISSSSNLITLNGSASRKYVSYDAATNTFFFITYANVQSSTFYSNVTFFASTDDGVTWTKRGVLGPPTITLPASGSTRFLYGFGNNTHFVIDTGTAPGSSPNAAYSIDGANTFTTGRIVFGTSGMLPRTISNYDSDTDSYYIGNTNRSEVFRVKRDLSSNGNYNNTAGGYASGDIAHFAKVNKRLYGGAENGRIHYVDANTAVSANGTAWTAKEVLGVSNIDLNFIDNPAMIYSEKHDILFVFYTGSGRVFIGTSKDKGNNYTFCNVSTILGSTANGNPPSVALSSTNSTKVIFNEDQSILYMFTSGGQVLKLNIDEILYDNFCFDLSGGSGGLGGSADGTGIANGVSGIIPGGGGGGKSSTGVVSGAGANGCIRIYYPRRRKIT